MDGEIDHCKIHVLLFLNAVTEHQVTLFLKAVTENHVTLFLNVVTKIRNGYRIYIQVQVL